MTTKTEPRSTPLDYEPPRSTSAGVISAILAKDVKAFRRDRFIVFITILTLITWAIVFYLLPSSVDETVELGVVVAELPTGAQDGAGLSGLNQDGVEITRYPTEVALRDAVAAQDVTAGFAIPRGFMTEIASGEQPEVLLIVPAGLPPQLEQLLTASINTIGYAMSGQAAPVDVATATEIIGVDRVGNQASLSEQMRPMLLISVLMLETIALGSLLSVEIANRTASAILVTPANPAQLLTAKAIFGIAFAFGEVMLLGLLIGAFAHNAAIIIVGLLLGAVLVTGLGLLVGALGRDFLDTLVLSMLVIIPLLVPAFAAIFPGATAGWVTLMPTYGLVEILTAGAASTISWSEVAGPMLVLLAWGFGLFAAGLLVLRKKVVAP
jgi:ABC-2 type transport system permease protein